MTPRRYIQIQMRMQMQTHTKWGHTELTPFTPCLHRSLWLLPVCSGQFPRLAFLVIGLHDRQLVLHESRQAGLTSLGGFGDFPDSVDDAIVHSARRLRSSEFVLA